MKKKLIIYILITFFCMLPISSYAWTEIGLYAPYYHYDNNNSHVCSDSGYYSWDSLGVGTGGVWYQLGSKGVDNSDFAYHIVSAFKYDLTANTFYDVKITFNGYDVRKALNSSTIHMLYGNGCSNLTENQTEVSLISFVNKATTEQYSNYITLRVYTSSLIGDWGVAIYNNNKDVKLTSQNWGISKVELKTVDMSGNKEVIESNTNNTNNIINNNNQNTQDIIDNQSENTQQIIDSNMSCQMIDNNNVVDKRHYLEINGSLSSLDNVLGITDFIKLDSNTKLKIVTSRNQGAAYCFYNSEKTLISCSNNYSITDITIPNNSSYFRASIHLSENKPQFEICKNGNQALTDTFTDDSIPTGNDYFDDFNEMLPSNNTISQLIGLPISLYTKILNSINGTCSPINLGSLYGTNLVMPCIDIGSYLGSTLWSTIDLIMSGAFVLIIAKKMIKAFEHFTSLKEGDVINND